MFFQHRDIGTQHRDVPERYVFNVTTLEPNVAMFPGPSTKNFCKNFLSVENSLHSALLFPKACTKLSMLFLLSHNNLGTSKHCNKNTSKLKQVKSNLANFKQEKTNCKNNLKAWVASQVALCLLLSARPSCVRLTGAQTQWNSGKPTFHVPEHCLCWFQTCGGLVLLELTTKIGLYSLPIHLKSTSFRMHQVDTTVWENLGDHKQSRPCSPKFSWEQFQT